MSNAQINQFPPTIIPDSLHRRRLATRVIGDSDFPRWFLNSTIVAGVTVVSNLVFCSLAGYAFARLRFRGSTALFLLILATLIIPFQLTMIPTFIVMDEARARRHARRPDRPRRWCCRSGVFLMRQFFVNLPAEVEEAARIDGCSRLGVLIHVAMPLARPALATLAALTFLLMWNDLLWPLIAINSDENFDPAARPDHVPGPAHAGLGGGDGGQRDHRDPGADRVPVRAEDVHPVAHLERREGIGAR